MDNPKVVKYSRRLRRISLQRFLISKVVFEQEKVTLSDLFALYDNQIWLERKCLTDNCFLKKFGRSLEDLSILMKECNLSRGLNSRTLNQMSQKAKNDLQGFLVPVRNYPSYKRRFGGLFSVRTLISPKESNKHIPPKRFMGIGYRDKGTRRDPAKDGSPSWQEVASRGGQLTLALKEIRNAGNFNQIIRAFEDLELITKEEGRALRTNPDPSKEVERKSPEKRVSD